CCRSSSRITAGGARNCSSRIFPRRARSRSAITRRCASTRTKRPATSTPNRSVVGIRYHQTLRFYPDEEAGYEYPDQYYRIFGHDYTPPQYIQDTYKMLKNHKWYMEPRLVTVNDLYAFDPNAKVSIDPFQDIIGRHFKQPKEGLGYDNSSSAHMWRTLARPDNPL